jgi:hypothetical protein
MIYLYFVLGISSLILSGMWFGTIVTDKYDNIKINTTQYAMTILTFITGICQFVMIYKNIVLE